MGIVVRAIRGCNRMTSLVPQNLNKSTGMYGVNKSVTVSNDFFGFNVLNYPVAQYGSVTSAPTIPYSIFRTHDCGYLKWWDIQPTASNVFIWSNADTILNYYLNAGKDILFTLYGTPTWASKRPAEALSPYNVLGGSAEPENMNDWANYCIAVATRYPTIKYFEVWNEPNPFVVFVLSGSSGSNTITLANTFNSGLITAGMLVSPNALGIPANCMVTGVSGLVVTLSTNLTANIANQQIEFSPYFTRTCTGTAGSNSLTVNNGTNIVAGAYLSLNSAQYIVQSISGTTVTLTSNLAKTVSGVTGTFTYQKTNLFFTGWRENLATMARVANIAIKSVNPNAIILSPPSGQVSSFFYPNVYSMPGNDLTQNIENHPALYTSQVAYNRVTQILTAKDVSGFYYNGTTGSGTQVSDWVDVIAEHLYIATDFEYQNVCYLKYLFSWLAFAGINKPVWNTEQGIDTTLSASDGLITQRLTRAIVLPVLCGCIKSIYYGWDFGGFAINNLSDTVKNALTNNINFVKGKTCIRLLIPYDGGSITAYFTDGSSLVF